MAEALLLDLHEGVQTITLNRPDKLNAFTTTMLRELLDTVRAAERDAAVKALVVTGAGRAFTSGQDLAEFDFPQGADGTAKAPDLGELLRGRVNPLILRMRALPKPILAAVNGVAAGAGMGFALACDLRYAAEAARFIQSFVNVGLVPDAGSMYFLPRLVGTSKALELAWTGDPVTAAEALGLGLVEKVVPDGEVVAQTQALAARLARGPAKALALTKRGLAQSHEATLERMLEVEASYQQIASQNPDFREGVEAFREKRPARFGGV